MHITVRLNVFIEEQPNIFHSQEKKIILSILFLKTLRKTKKNTTILKLHVYEKVPI